MAAPDAASLDPSALKSLPDAIKRRIWSAVVKQQQEQQQLQQAVQMPAQVLQPTYAHQQPIEKVISFASSSPGFLLMRDDFCDVSVVQARGFLSRLLPANYVTLRHVQLLSQLNRHVGWKPRLHSSLWGGSRGWAALTCRGCGLM